jgi:DNA-binding MarR family transcriptional regulator
MVADSLEPAQRILLLLGRLGLDLTDRISESVGPDLSSNASIVTLFTLDLQGPQRPGAIQELTGLSSGGVSKLVDRLAGSGLVERAHGTIIEDRRAIEVRLTAKGRRASRRIAQVADSRRAEFQKLVKEIDVLLER